MEDYAEKEPVQYPLRVERWVDSTGAQHATFRGAVMAEHWNKLIELINSVIYWSEQELNESELACLAPELHAALGAYLTAKGQPLS